MKRRLLPLLLGATLLLTACGAAPRGTGVGIITNVPTQSGAAEVAAALAAELAGETVDALAAEEEIGALLLHRAIPGSAEALRRAREKGIFVGVCAERAEAAELAGAADVTLLWDSESAGTLLAEQARDMGASPPIPWGGRSWSCGRSAPARSGISPTSRWRRLPCGSC